MMHVLSAQERFTRADLPVFIVRCPVDCDRANLRKEIGPLVVIDDGVYGVKAIEAFAVPHIHQGMQIGIMTTTVEPVRRISRR